MTYQCPKCDANLPPKLSSGRVVCRKCGWNDQLKKYEVELPGQHQATKSGFSGFFYFGNNSIPILGWVLFGIGSVMMLIGLAYDPTVSSRSSSGFSFERTYNIGEISNKATYTNTGGFLAVCGAIFATLTRKS